MPGEFRYHTEVLRRGTNGRVICGFRHQHRGCGRWVALDPYPGHIGVRLPSGVGAFHGVRSGFPLACFLRPAAGDLPARGLGACPGAGLRAFGVEGRLGVRASQPPVHAGVAAGFGHGGEPVSYTHLRTASAKADNPPRQRKALFKKGKRPTFPPGAFLCQAVPLKQDGLSVGSRLAIPPCTARRGPCCGPRLQWRLPARG